MGVFIACLFLLCMNNCLDLLISCFCYWCWTCWASVCLYFYFIFFLPSLLIRFGFRTEEPNGGRGTQRKWPLLRRSTTPRRRKWRRALTTRRTTSTTNPWTQIQTTKKSRDSWKSTRLPTWRWSAPAVTARTPCDPHSLGGTQKRGPHEDLSHSFRAHLHLTFPTCLLRDHLYSPTPPTHPQAEIEKCVKLPSLRPDAREKPKRWPSGDAHGCIQTHPDAAVCGAITVFPPGLEKDWWGHVYASWKDTDAGNGNCPGDANEFLRIQAEF